MAASICVILTPHALADDAAAAAKPKPGSESKPPKGKKKKKKQKKKRKKATAAAERPNIVMVMTDDQDTDSVRVMPHVRELAASGTTFNNSFVNYPQCCPARATYLTGQYAQNHRVLSSALPFYHNLDDSNTLPVWLQRSGYTTALIGKYLNGYGLDGPPYIPPGWSEWYGSIDGWTYLMYGTRLFENGTEVRYGLTPDQYQTDVYTRKAEEFIRRRAPEQRPFFLSLAPLAPHAEATQGLDSNPRPAPRHVGAFANEPLPRPPSFNEADVSDKPPEIRNLAPLNPQQIDAITNRYRSRLASLLAVDDMVGKLRTTLAQTGELDNTIFVFTSDNGFILGQHRFPEGKNFGYEESIRVPLIMSGPSIPQGVRRSELVANVDLAPTLMDYAGATAGLSVDGTSLRPVIARSQLRLGRGIALVGGLEKPTYIGVRTPRYTFLEYTPENQELYDLKKDPYQLESRHRDPDLAGVRGELRKLALTLVDCAGPSCSAPPRLWLRAACKGRGKLSIAGADLSSVVEARFTLGRRSANDTTRPFTRRIKGPRTKAATALVTLRDSRELTLTRKLKAGCGQMRR